MEIIQAEKLYLNGDKLNADAMIEKLNREENSSPRELYIHKISEVIPIIADFLPNFSNLETLTMGGGLICVNDAHTVANFIANSALLKLELLNYYTLPSTFAIIFDSARMSGLRTLNFCGRYFVKSELDIITKVVVSLTKLSFIRCKFDYHGFVSMMDAIKRSTLVTLILDCNHFDDKESITISDCVANSKLIKLSLHDVSFTEDKSNTILEAIKRSTIKTLDMRDMPFLNKFDTINDLILNCCITKLKFDQRALDVEEKKALLNSIQQNYLFEHLSFDGAIFDEALVEKTCELLENAHARLKSFDLYPGLLPGDMLNKIINSIKKSSITSLKFREYQPTAKSTAIMKDLLEGYHFEKLGLHFMHCESATVEEILPAMRASSIIKFNITQRPEPMSDDMRDKIEQILQVNRKIARNHRNIKSARVHVKN